MRKQIHWRKMRIMRIMHNKDEQVCVAAYSCQFTPGKTQVTHVTHSYFISYAKLRMVTHGYAGYASLHHSVLIGHAELLCFTLIYWDSYASLSSFTGIVSHGYAYLPGWLRTVTQMYTHCYALLRIVTWMVTHGYADLRGLLRMVTHCYRDGYISKLGASNYD